MGSLTESEGRENTAARPYVPEVVPDRRTKPLTYTYHSVLNDIFRSITLRLYRVLCCVCRVAKGLLCYVDKI